MNKYPLIEKFFHDQDEYIEFLVKGKELLKANDERTCVAQLKKEGDCFLFKLVWVEDGRSIGDYIDPFRASQDNIDQFNRGCALIAQRLRILLETDDPSAVPSHPPAFGDLTATGEKIKFDYSNGYEPYNDRYWRNKKTGKIELIRIPVRRMRDAPVIRFHKPILEKDTSQD